MPVAKTTREMQVRRGVGRLLSSPRVHGLHVHKHLPDMVINGQCIVPRRGFCSTGKTPTKPCPNEFGRLLIVGHAGQLSLRNG